MEELKEKIEEIVNKVKNDENFANNFKENPVKAIEEGFKLCEKKFYEFCLS